MRKKALFFPVLAALMLAGCSNDVADIADSPSVFTDDEAYITVRLSDAGSIQSRATTTADPGYECGSEAEHKVTNAYFYFYDKAGLFVSEGNAWNGGTAEEKGNIEFKSSTVVALRGLTEKNLPKYMVTVLNRPSDFTPGATLVEMEKKLASNSSVGIRDGNNNFVMSTTSYENGELENEKQLYFVTQLDDKNFSPEPISDTENFVLVYVERLAAKVTLGVSDELKTQDINGKEYYVIKATVAGEDNAADKNDETSADEDLYVELLGWRLNATAKRSNIVKNIDEGWVNTEEGALGFVWNKPSDYRSFWGKSFNYGQTDGKYPTKASEADECKYLNYVNLQSCNEIGKDAAYCAENTNTSDIVTQNFPSAVTSILLKARIGKLNTDNEVTYSTTFVRFNGMLYEENRFIDFILAAMQSKGLLPYVQENENYIEIDKDNVELKSNGDGAVKVILKDGTYYNKEGQELTIATVNTDLEEECKGAIGYKGGLMYYNIPIEHLNNNSVGEDGNIPEAKYGVVRNHHYDVTINKLDNIGKGIFDPDEVIVPGKDEDKDTYYVGANINILSWKIVNQTVEL